MKTEWNFIYKQKLSTEQMSGVCVYVCGSTPMFHLSRCRILGHRGHQQHDEDRQQIEPVFAQERFVIALFGFDFFSFLELQFFQIIRDIRAHAHHRTL